MCQCCGGHNHTTTVFLKVEGMSCGHCSKAVEDSVGKLSGVEKVSVNLADKEVKVEFNSDLVTIAAIEEAIVEEGYEVIK